MSARGQSMVLLALLMFLVAAMVLVTLSVGQRAREQVEAQLAADAAAYSNGITAARTLNEIALANRTTAALQVAYFGTQSLVSWAGHHRTNLAATADALQQAKAPYAPCCGNPFCPQAACSCAELALLDRAIGEVGREQQRIEAQWDRLDDAAAEDAFQLWEASVEMHDVVRESLARLDQRIEKQRLTGIIAALASPELGAPEAGDRKSRLELRDDEGCQGADGVLCSGSKRPSPLPDLEVPMGTRGWHFTTARAGGEPPMRDKLQEVVARVNALASVNPAAEEGGVGQGLNREGAQRVKSLEADATYAEDHGGTLRLDWPSQTGCFPSGASVGVNDSWLRANHAGLAGDRHQYTGAKNDGRRHDLRINAGDMGSWPWTYEFNYTQLSKPKNDFGQPKLYAIVERDFAQRSTPWPWDLFVRFRFSANSTSELDLGRPEGGLESQSGASLRHQVAVGSSVVYYHRPGHWREPPNLWNPFWRSTLAAPDDDLPKYLASAGYPDQADTVKRLLALGAGGTQ